jgi:hypothetical protein
VQWYNNKSWHGVADAVPVVIRQETPNINAQLEDGGTITGQVTDAVSGQSIANVTVRAVDEANWLIFSGVTDANGQYTIFQVPTCGVKLFFNAGTTGYSSQWYSDKASFATADVVPATAGVNVAGIDAQLKVQPIDFIGTWDGQGVYYRNSETGAWAKLATPATLITAGDLDGDGIDDLIGIWPGQGGVWVKYSDTGSWAKLSSTARHIAVGLMRGVAGAAEVLAEPIGGFAEGPGNFGYQDLSEAGPGGLRFLCREEENLMPLEDRESALRRVPGPGE